jgi:RLL motif-containing protein 1
MSLTDYLRGLGCPHTLTEDSLIACTHWLLSYAVSLEFDDCLEQGISVAEGDTQSQPMEMDSDETTGGSLAGHIDKLGRLLSLTRITAEDNISFLDRLGRRTRLYVKSGSLRALESAMAGEQDVDGSCSNSLNDFPLGFDTGDIDINDVCLVLRMLHLYDLRELQHDLNSLLVMGQEYTANP